MAIPVGSPEAREVRFFSQNPQFANDQPLLRLPQRAIVNSVEGYRPDNTKLAATNIQYRVEVRSARALALEPRWATLVTEDADDIFALARQPGFRAQQLVVEDPSADEKNWKAYLWQAPREEVFCQLAPGKIDYAGRLMQGQIPWVDMSKLGGGYYGALNRIAADNSAFVRGLASGLPERQPVTAEVLMGIADKYDPNTPYDTRYPGLFLNYINLPRSDMLAFAILYPKQRLEYLAITDPRGQAEFLAEGIREGLRVVTQKSGKEDADMMADLRRRVTSPNNPTSNNDMEQVFAKLTKGREYLGAVISKLLFAVNLPSSKIVTLTMMEPPHRLSTLIQEDDATKAALMEGANQIRSSLLRLHPQQARPVALWMGADKLKAA